jgi:sugar-specific transcriptional regulator TrmB
MEINNRIKRLLVMSGLTEDEARLYLYVLQNKGCSIMDVARECGIPKTTAYRLFGTLKEVGLVNSTTDSWENSLVPLPIDAFIKKWKMNKKTGKGLCTN